MPVAPARKLKTPRPISGKDLYRTLKALAGFIEPSPYGGEHRDLNLGLHFTGGEHFLNFELLCTAVGHLSKCHLCALIDCTE